MNECLPANLKLKSKKSIEGLFENGKSVKAFPLLLIYKKDMETELPFKVGFSVSKRFFKLAVDRNRVKRLMRESFRKNKYLFTVEEQAYFYMFIYTGKTLPTQLDIEKSMLKIAKKFSATL